MYKTLAELYGAYQAGKITSPLILDNDDTAVYDDASDRVFGMHPDDVLRQALGILNIPFDDC